MKDDVAHILSVLDRCCDNFTFPMLDNGYVYLAATRLSLHRSEVDWAMVLEVFGFSPRAGLPDTYVYTFGSRLHERDGRDKYVSLQAYENYLAQHPHDDARFFYPIDQGEWQDADCDELVANDEAAVIVRGRRIPTPHRDEYARHGIELASPDRVEVFELCRYLAGVDRDLVLATPTEQRVSVRPEMSRLLQLDEWHHPDVVDKAARPSKSETFRQLAQVLVTGDVRAYRPTAIPNTHWKNWPDGGTL
jgi:hypothetical protein